MVLLSMMFSTFSKYMEESPVLLQMKFAEDINAEETSKCPRGSVSFVIQVALDCLF